jgi:hypothetical protein
MLTLILSSLVLVVLTKVVLDCTFGDGSGN